MQSVQQQPLRCLEPPAKGSHIEVGNLRLFLGVFSQAGHVYVGLEGRSSPVQSSPQVVHFIAISHPTSEAVLSD